MSETMALLLLAAVWQLTAGKDIVFVPERVSGTADYFEVVSAAEVSVGMTICWHPSRIFCQDFSICAGCRQSVRIGSLRDTGSAGAPLQFKDLAHNYFVWTAVSSSANIFSAGYICVVSPAALDAPKTAAPGSYFAVTVFDALMDADSSQLEYVSLAVICSGSQFSVQCTEKSSNSCGVFTCLVMSSVCAGLRVRLVYTSSTSAVIEAAVNMSPPASISVAPAIIPEVFDTLFVKITVSYEGQACPSEGVNVTIANQADRPVLFLPRSIDSTQSCLQVFQVCSPTHFTNACQIVFQGLSLQFLFQGLIARLYTAAPFPMQVSPIVIEDSVSVVPFTVQMFFPESHGVSFTNCELVVNDKAIGRVQLLKSHFEIDVFRGNGSICTNSKCASAHPAAPLISGSKFDVQCFSGLQLSNGTLLKSQARVSVVRPCPVLLSSNGSSPASSRASIPIGGSVFVTIIDSVFCDASASLTLLVTSSNFLTQVNVSMPHITGNECGKRLSFGPDSTMNVNSSSDVTFVYCGEGTRVCSSASLRVIGPVIFRLSHSVLLSQSVQVVLFSVTDYNSSNNVSLSSSFVGSAELVLFETSEGSGIFESSALVCCNVDGCPGLSSPVGFAVKFYYQGKLFPESFNCLNVSSIVNTSNCLNSTAVPYYFPVSKLELHVYNFFLDSPFSVSVQGPVEAQSLRFIGLNVICNMSVVVVPLYRSSAFSFDGTFSSIFTLCPNVTVGAQVNFTARVSNQHVSATAVVESVPLTSLLVDSSQSVIQGAQLHVTIRRNSLHCHTCSGQLMLTVRSSFSVIVVPSPPLHGAREVFVSFRICGPKEQRYNRGIECVHSAVGDILTLETPGCDPLRLEVATAPSVIVSVTHVRPESCFFVFLSHFSRLMSFRLEASELFPQRNSYGNYFIRACLSREKILYIDGVFGLNATSLSSFSFGLLVKGTQVSSAEVLILLGRLTVTFANLPMKPILSRGSLLSLLVNVQNLHLSHSNLSVFTSSGQLLTIPFVVNSSASALIPVTLDSGCLSNMNSICALDGIIVIASVCTPFCISSGPTQIFFAPEIYAPSEHPAGTSLRINVLDSSITSDHIFVNISLGFSYKMHRLNRNSSSSHFEGFVRVLDLELANHQLPQLAAGKAPYMLRIEYFDVSKSVLIVKQTSALLSCFEENASNSSFKVFRVVLSHLGATALEYVDVKLSSGTSIQSRPIRLIRNAKSHMFLGFVNITSSIIAMLGPELKISYLYDFEFQPQVASCNISVKKIGSLVVAPPAISLSQAFEVSVFHYAEIYEYVALVEACFVNLALPCINIRLELSAPGHFFAVFNSSQMFPFANFGAILSPLTVCFTFGAFQSCILVADRFDVEYPPTVFSQGSVSLVSKSFVPVTDNMPKELECSFFSLRVVTQSLFNVSLPWNASSLSFGSSFVIHDQCKASCDDVSLIHVICRYGSISSSFSMSMQVPLLVRIQVPDTFVPKSSLRVAVIDSDSNQDSSLVESAYAIIESDSLLIPEKVELVETGPSTGVFCSNISTGSSTRIIVSFRSRNGQSVRATAVSSASPRADLTVLHCNRNFQCIFERPYQLPLITHFRVCAPSLVNLVLKVSCSSSSELLIPIRSEDNESCWSAFVFLFQRGFSDVPKSFGSNQFFCFTHESSLVVSSVVQNSQQLIPISPLIMFVIPQGPVLFASPIFFSSSSNVSIFLQNVPDSSSQVLKVISSNGKVSHITMKQSKPGDFVATFDPAMELTTSFSVPVLTFVWRDTLRDLDLECNVAACGPAIMDSPASIGFQGVANISIFKNQASLKIVLQVNNTATKQTTILPVVEKLTNASGTLYQASLHISSSRSGFGFDGQPLVFALVGSVLVVSFEDSCPFSVVQATILVTESHAGTVQAPSVVLAGGDINVTVDDYDFISSNLFLNAMFVNVQATSSLDFKRFRFPAQSRKFTVKIPTTTNTSLVNQSPLLVNRNDSVILVYEDAAPYKRFSVTLSILPSCAANISVGPLPLELNRNISIRVMDCDVYSDVVSIRVSTSKGFCDVDLKATPTSIGVFATSIILNGDNNTHGACNKLLATAGDLVTFQYLDVAPQSTVELVHILHNESVATLEIDKYIVMLNDTAKVTLTMCINSDTVDPLFVRSIRSFPSPKFSDAAVSDGTEIQLKRISECVFFASIRTVLLPNVPVHFDHNWMKLYSSPCDDCVFASEGDKFRVRWPSSDSLETTFAIAQLAFFQAPVFVAAGSEFEIHVFDSDANANVSARDQVRVDVTYLDESVSFFLLENATNSGIFRGSIFLSSFSALSSMTIPFLTNGLSSVLLRYSDKYPSVIIESRVNLTSNYFAKLEVSPQTGQPGSSVMIQVVDATRNQNPFVRENVSVSVEGVSVMRRIVQLFETSENSGVFQFQFILSNGSVMYDAANPFGVRALPGQKISIKYTNSAPLAVMTKNIVVAGSGRILVNAIDLLQVVEVTLIDPDNSDFYTDASTVRKIQNLIATSASGNFLAFTVQERDPGTGVFQGTFNVSSSATFRPGVLVGVSLASRVEITYADLLPSMTVTTSVKVASVGSIVMVTSSSGSAASDSEFVFNVVDFDMNSDPLRQEFVSVAVFSVPNSNFSVKCTESTIDSSAFICRLFFNTKLNVPSTLDASVHIIPASRGQVFSISYLDSIPTPSTFRTASITVANAGALSSNTSLIYVGQAFAISLENVYSNTNPVAKDSVFLTVEHRFAGLLTSSTSFALPETLASSALFTGIVATSPLASPQSNTFASVVVPSVQPGSLLVVSFRQPAFNLVLNVSVIVLSTPVLLVPTMLLNTDSTVLVSLSSINLNATNVLTSSLNVTVTQTAVSPKLSITLTLFASNSDSSLFTGALRLCSVSNCTSGLFAPDGSSVNFSYVDRFTGIAVALSRSVSTRGRMQVPKTTLSQSTITILVSDIDMDVSFALDTLVVFASVVGDTRTVSITLTETDSKSGIFRGVLPVKDVSMTTAAGAINAPPNGTIQIAYEDAAPPIVVLSSVVVSAPNQIVFASPIVIGSVFAINVSDSGAFDPRSVLELSYWGGGTRVILDLISPGLYSGRAMIADDCSNTSLFSGCLSIMYNTEVQVVYSGSSQISVTIPFSAMTRMIPTIQVCVLGKCTSSWDQSTSVVITNGAIVSVLVVDYDFANLVLLSQFVSVSCGGVDSDSVYLDASRGSLSATQFSASLTVFNRFDDYIASSAGAKIVCPPGSVLLFQIRDCDLTELVLVSARVIDVPRLQIPPSFVIGDHLELQLHDVLASSLEVSITCISSRDIETTTAVRKALGDMFLGSIYISAALSSSNDGRLSVARDGERIDCNYLSDENRLNAYASSVARDCSQFFRIGYLASNTSSKLVLDVILCEPLDYVSASIHCSSGDIAEFDLSVDPLNPSRYVGTIGYTPNLASVTKYDMIVSLDPSVLIPCVSAIRLPARNTTLSGSLYRRAEPELTAYFDSSSSIRVCILDVDAVSYGSMGSVVSFSLHHASGMCSNQLKAYETAPFSGLFCRSGINMFTILNASPCNTSKMFYYYNMIYQGAQLRIPIRSLMSFLGTPSSAAVGGSVSLKTSVLTANFSASLVDLIYIFVRYSSGIQEQVLLNESGIATASFTGSIYVPPMCSQYSWNRSENQKCHDTQSTYVELFMDFLQAPFVINLHLPPQFYVSPQYPVIGRDVFTTVVVPNVSLAFVDAVVTSSSLAFPVRFQCSDQSSLCTGVISGALFRSSTFTVTLLLSFGVFNFTVAGNAAPSMKSYVSFDGTHHVAVNDCDTVANASVLTTSCNSNSMIISMASNGCILTAKLNLSQHLLQSNCSSVILYYRNLVVFTQAILALYNPTLGVVNVAASAAAGSSFSVFVSDLDANINPLEIDTITVTICSSRNVEPCKDIKLTESSNSSGIFAGTIVTVLDASVSGPDDGFLNVLPNHFLKIEYFDSSSSQRITRSVLMVAPCSWSAGSIPLKLVAGDTLSISVSDVDLNPQVRGDRPNSVHICADAVWFYCNLQETTADSGIYVGSCNTTLWPVGSSALIYYNCSQSNMQLSASVQVVSAPSVIVSPNPVLLGDPMSIVVVDSLTASSFVDVSLVRGSAVNAITLRLLRANNSAFSAIFPTKLTADVLSCTFPITFLPSMQYINVSYSVASRPLFASLVQLKPRTRLSAILVFPNIWLEVINPDTIPYNLNFGSYLANLSCSVFFSFSGWTSVRLIYSDSIQNLTCNQTAIIIPTSSQLHSKAFYVQFLDSSRVTLSQQQISIPNFPSFYVSNVSSTSQFFSVSVFGLDDEGTNATLYARSFSSTGSVVDVESSLLQNRNNGSFTATFRMSSTVSDGNLVLVPQGHVEFFVNGFTSAKFYLHRPCPVSIFADYLNSSRREVFVDVRTCSGDSISTTVSALPAQSAITLSMAQVASGGLQILRSGRVPVSFSTQSSGVLYLQEPATVQVTVLIGGDTISKSFLLPAWRNISCFSISDSSRIANAVASRGRLVVSTTPNSNFSDPIYIQLSVGSDVEVIPAAKQSNEDWVASFSFEYLAYAIIGDGKLTNVTLGSIIVASIGHLSCSALVYMQPSLTVYSNFDGSSWILAVHYAASSQNSSQAVFAYANLLPGSVYSILLESTAPYKYFGSLNVGSFPCYNASITVIDFHEGNLSRTLQLPCQPHLSMYPSSNRSSSFVAEGELLDIEVDFVNSHHEDVMVQVRYDNLDPIVHQLHALSGSHLFRVTVVANAKETVSVNLSSDAFVLYSSILVVSKPVIRFHPAVITSQTSELFVFVIDSMQPSQPSVAVALSINGCSNASNVLITCAKDSGIFVGRVFLSLSERCVGLRIVASYTPRTATSNISAFLFASPQTEISTFVITPVSAIMGDIIEITLNTSSSAPQPTGFVVFIHGDPCGTAIISSSVVLLPLFSGSNVFRASLQVGSADAVLGSCALSEPGRYIFTVNVNSSFLADAYVDINFAVPAVTLNATRVEQGHPANIMVMDLAAKRRSNISVTVKVLGYSIPLVLQQVKELFVSILRYELVAEILLDAGFSSVECTIEYTNAAGSLYFSNVIFGTPLVPELLNAGDVVAFSLDSPHLCSVPPSQFRVTATSSTFPERPVNLSVSSLLKGTSCQISCRFKTSLYTQTRPGHLELFHTVTAVPGDALLISVVFPFHKTIVHLKSQALFNPSVGINAPSYISVGSAFEVKLSGFGLHYVSVLAKNTAFQNAIFASLNHSLSSNFSVRTSNLAFSPSELLVRPGDFITIQARVDRLGLFAEAHTAVAEVASIRVDPANPDFGSVIQIQVFDADAPFASQAIVSIVRNGNRLRTSNHRISLRKQTPRILSAQFNLSSLIFARMTDSLIISYRDANPYSVVSLNVSFRRSPQLNFSTVNSVGFSGNLTSSLSLSPSGKLRLEIVSAGATYNSASPLPCNVYSLQSGSSSHLDMESMMMYANAIGVLSGSIELVSVELSTFSGKCASVMDGCLVVHSLIVVNITCGNFVSANFVHSRLPIHGFFDDATNIFAIFTGHPDASVAITASERLSNSTDPSCQSTCARVSGFSVSSCSLCDSPLLRFFRAEIEPSSDLIMTPVIFKSEPLAPLHSFALADSSLFCLTATAAFASIALSQSSNSCGNCDAHIANWNSSSSMFELMVPFSSLNPFINSSSCVHVWLVLPSRAVFSSAVCFSAPEFTSSTPPQDSMFPLGLDCNREVDVAVTSSAVCYRLQSETSTLHVTPTSPTAARISLQYSPALQLPARVCVQAMLAPLGCSGPMGSGPKKLFSTRCWSLVMEPCVACARIGDNLVTISHRYFVDAVAVASIFFAARANTMASDSRGIETELPFGTPVRLGVVYEGSAGESFQFFERFSRNRNVLSVLNPDMNADSSIEDKLVCLPVDVQPL